MIAGKSPLFLCLSPSHCDTIFPFIVTPGEVEVISILLVRHGQTEANLKRLLQGWEDTPLTELGVRQAEALRSRLATERLDRVITSDLARAESTAHILMSGRKPPYLATSLIRERAFGKMELASVDEWDKLKIPFGERHYTELTPDGGESFRDLRLRVQHFVGTLSSVVEGEQVLVVGHSTWNKHLVAELLRVPDENYGLINQSNCGISCMVRDAETGLWRGIYINDVSHLSGMESM